MIQPTQQDFMVKQIERIAELSTAYVMFGMHELEPDEDSISAAAEFMVSSLSLGQYDPVDTTALLGAKVLTSFYALVRACVGEELIDPIWKAFFETQAAHRASLPEG